ncbi:D-alanyl-D-alanine carboxypeptidase [Frondihabitans sp. 762G35]|uniref:M15 family metallopeptidase n=1 Tax=Frondihabitans sp. 762G35 TaxID=1446794 RepID=UPI000D21DC61|nr:M15 family metallopeptidase [Frondihabitans sp. 762G35]ARC55970.1 D-alanyl-D-alanine carboxypeptidase [Frondihabitans sp. 762G35]
MPANGTLDISTLEVLENFAPYQDSHAASVVGSDRLTAEAARQARLMQADFKRDLGITLFFAEAYRPLANQRLIFGERYVRTSRNTGLWYDGSYWSKKAGEALAALPGTSTHGLGVTVDWRSGIGDPTSRAYKWMAANAHRYGWVNDVPSELWHWHFIPGTATNVAPVTASAGNGNTTLIGDEEMALTEEGKAEIKAIVYAVLTDTNVQIQFADAAERRTPRFTPAQIAAKLAEKDGVLDQVLGQVKSLRTFANELPKRVYLFNRNPQL